MELSFEYHRNLGAGGQPSAIHTADNFVQVFHVTAGQIHAMSAETPLGEWGELFGSPHLAARDEAVAHLKMKYLSGVNIWATWQNLALPEDRDYVADYDRHRVAVFRLFQNVSKYLSSGSLEFSQTNPVTQLILELENPGQTVAGEYDAIVAPGAMVTLSLRMGNTPRYALGRYYVDRNQMSVTNGTTSLEGRNTIGKLLKDQTFDETNSYPYNDFELVLADIMDNAGVFQRNIYDSANLIGMTFPADMSILDGIQTLMNAVSDGTLGGWAIKEQMDGTVVLGPLEWTGHDQPGSYTFTRGTDIFSREVTRDDADAYSRVRVYTTTQEVYRTVEGRFPLPTKKTLHVELPEGTLLADMEDQADALADRLSQVGVVETFTGPIRPHIQPGDEARIVDGGSQLLGLITTVRHTFGTRGFSTEFTVDSGGVIGRAQIQDFITKIAGKQPTASGVTRLYA